MKLSYPEQFQALIQSLAQNSQVQLLRQDISTGIREDDYLRQYQARVAERYGFDAGFEICKLFLATQKTDICWTTGADTPLADGGPELMGCISLLSLSKSLNDSAYRLDLLNPSEEFTNASFFETGGAEDAGLRTLLRYDREKRAFLGMAVFDRPDVLPLTTSIDAYVQAALDWRGAYAWQLLYLPFDLFQALPLPTRRHVYRFPQLLPALFPDADWSVIKEKQAYFDTNLEQQLAQRAGWARPLTLPT